MQTVHGLCYLCLSEKCFFDALSMQYSPLKGQRWGALTLQPGKTV